MSEAPPQPAGDAAPDAPGPPEAAAAPDAPGPPEAPRPAAPASAHAGNPSRRRVILRRIVRDISSVLMISGLLLVADAAVTLLWQEPVTAVIAMIKRGEVNQRFLSYATAPLTPVQRHALVRLPDVRRRIRFLAGQEEHQVRTGDGIGRILIPRIGVSFVVVQGTDEGSLEKGPGHYPGTAFPGQGQTVAVAGHRTTYLAPFRHIDALRPGDPIVLEMPYGRFTYVVQFHRIVLPTALWVTHDVGYERLVLSACNPLYSAAQRIIVFARLKSVKATLPTRARA